MKVEHFEIALKQAIDRAVTVPDTNVNNECYVPETPLEEFLSELDTFETSSAEVELEIM